MYRMLVNDPCVEERARPGDLVVLGEVVDQEWSPLVAAFFRLVTIHPISNRHGILHALLEISKGSNKLEILGVYQPPKEHHPG